MKIKMNNILEKFLEKLNLRIITKEEKGEVIKFETDISTNEKHTRAGAIKDEEQNIKDVRVKKQAVKILASMILLFILTITLTYNKNSVAYQEPSLKSIAVSSSVDNTILDDIEKEENNNFVEENNNTKDNSVYAVKEEVLIFSPPIYGEIQKMYSPEKVIYSKTLDMWKTHSGVDISSSIGSIVKACEKGIVADVFQDGMLGNTVVIEHIAGYKTYYSNLENICVEKGQSVIKGQKIGSVGDSAISEHEDMPHLHFEVKQNNKNVDPTYIFE